MKEPPTILACVVAISPGTLRTNVWVFRRAEVAAGRKNLKCGRHKSWHDTFNEISMLCQTVDCLLYLPLTLTILTIWQSSRSAFNEIIQRQLQLLCWRFCESLFCFFFLLFYLLFFFFVSAVRVSCGEQVNALSALCRLMMMMMLLLLAATRRMLHIHTPRSPKQTKRNFQTLMENTLPLMQMRIAKCGMLISLIRKRRTTTTKWPA